MSATLAKNTHWSGLEPEFQKNYCIDPGSGDGLSFHQYRFFAHEVESRRRTQQATTVVNSSSSSSSWVKPIRGSHCGREKSGIYIC